jgi:hypothetical protein
MREVMRTNAAIYNLRLIRPKNEQLKVNPCVSLSTHFTHNKVLRSKHRSATGLSHTFFLGFCVTTSKFHLHKTANYIKSLGAGVVEK